MHTRVQCGLLLVKYESRGRNHPLFALNHGELKKSTQSSMLTFLRGKLIPYDDKYPQSIRKNLNFTNRVAVQNLENIGMFKVMTSGYVKEY